MPCANITTPRSAACLIGCGVSGPGSEVAPDPLAMDAPLFPEVLLRPTGPQTDLPLVSAGVLRYLWQARYGDILIEVVHGEVRVNGAAVVPMPAR